MKNSRRIRSTLLATVATVLLVSPTVYAAEEIRLMLIERNPWLMVVGSDSPTFVLYETRRAIWWEGGEDSGHFMTAILSQNETDELLGAARALSGFDDYVSLSDWTDQTTQEMYFWSSDELIQKAVYGSLRDSEVRASAAPQILTIFDKLVDYENPDTQIWSPTYLEVMIWPYEYAPDESIIWPTSWPDVDAPTTKHRGDSHSLYIPYAEKAKLYEFLNTRTQKAAVLINERKWAVSVRIPFPHEFNVGSK